MLGRLLVAVLTLHTVCGAPVWYLQEREAILARESGETVGGNITLTPGEKVVDRIIMAAKQEEILSAIYNNTDFLPAMHFFQARPLMERSKVFQILKTMPKAGALHLHFGSITSVDWLVQNVTYRSHCYMCVASDGSISQLRFFLKPPPDTDCHWLEVAKERTKHADVKAFDKGIYQQLVLTVDHPDQVYPDLSSVWSGLEKFFDVIRGMLNFAPVMRDTLYQTFLEFHRDGVQYLEIRMRNEPYELDGTIHTQRWMWEMFRDVINDFKRDYPDFIGAKFIYAGIKRGGRGLALEDVKYSLKELNAFPDLFVGYDMVQQEDVTPSLLYFSSELLYPESHGDLLPYFFHAGETDWLNMRDVNLIDAILLNTSRIGHGFAITKHPEVMRLVKERDIAVEVNPLSNQVLKLVSDLRNHPASTLISQNFPLCISSDDPVIWEALPLSHDFYVAFMALAGADDGLAFLKQMAINSIEYSAMSDLEKVNALRLWEIKWDDFIRNVQATHNHSGDIDIVG